ncbi:MAG: hypothetical protein LBM75_01305 [Myxococcales bacterium]|jgi:energy-coupling factor transporter ATP-binding protein EcfA2|nr:hypothetical protein [Myxococcales bacterium]
MPQPLIPADFSLHKLVALIGPYGSGKSELSLALARLMARQRGATRARFARVALGDIDVLKPYFRSRESGEPLRIEGVTLLAPGGCLRDADLPILTPELRGALLDPDTQLILDVGGDPVGARALGSLRDAMVPGECDVWLVLNKNRPFMQSVQSVIEQAQKIQSAAGLELTGIVSNTHMMEETTVDDIAEGLDLAQRVGRELGIPVRLVGLNEEMASRISSSSANESSLLGDIPAIVLGHCLRPAFLGGHALAPRMNRLS